MSFILNPYRYALAGLAIPAGAIAGFVGGSAPSGWSLLTATDGKLIVGAGSTYSVTGTGGDSSSVSVSTTSTTNGNHVYNAHAAGDVANNAGKLGTTTAGNHSHTVSGSASAHDVTKDYALIKATTDQTEMPIDSRCFGVTDLTGIGLVNVDGTVDRFLRGSNIAGIGTTAGSASASIACTTNSAGDHQHGTKGGDRSYDYNADFAANLHGASTHTVTMAAALDTKRMYMSMWHIASSVFGLDAGCILMYDGATAPAGWGLLDGSGGRPDMRDYFLRIGSTAQHGTTSGDNQVTLAGTLSAHPSHYHSEGNTNTETGTGDQFGAYAMPAHTASQIKTILQNYYAMNFITPL